LLDVCFLFFLGGFVSTRFNMSAFVYGKITRVECVMWNFNDDFDDRPEPWNLWEGVLIHTENAVIRLLITHGQRWTEVVGWLLNGVFTDSNALDYLVGEVVDHVALNPERERQLPDMGNVNETTNMICVDVSLNGGSKILEFDLFNHHNGYLWHDVWMSWPGTEQKQSI
jgi:hypothetical protein